MQNLAKITHELLYDHDCVIVSGLGGFITQNKNAHWDKDKNEIHPPKKTLAFNSRLDQNDGLLAKRLQSQSGLSYSQAISHIEEWSQLVLTELKETGHCKLNGLGTLYKAGEDSPVFVPEQKLNFKKSTFALESIRIKSNTKKSSEQSKRNLKTQETRAKNFENTKLDKKNINLTLINVLGSVFILAMVFSLLNMELGPNKDLQYLSQYLDSAEEWNGNREADQSVFSQLLTPPIVSDAYLILLNGTFSNEEVEKIVEDLDRLYIQNEIIERENKEYQINVISFMDKQLAERYKDLLQKRIPYELTITAK